MSLVHFVLSSDLVLDLNLYLMNVGNHRLNLFVVDFSVH